MELKESKKEVVSHINTTHYRFEILPRFFYFKEIIKKIQFFVRIFSLLLSIGKLN